MADAIRTAAANISGNKLRSLLTVVIVTLGITCLVGSQTAIDCLSSLLESAFGTSDGKITLTSVRKSTGGRARPAAPLCYRDAAEFMSGFSTGDVCVYTYVPLQEQVAFAGTQLGPQTSVIAFEGDYLKCNGLRISTGRECAVFTGAAECVVGKKVADRLDRKSNGQTAVGLLLNIGGKAFRIAGVLSSESSLLGVLTDNTIYIPLSAAIGSLVSSNGGFSIDISVPGAEAREAAGRAGAMMRRIRHLGAGEKPDFDMIEGSAAAQEIQRLGGSLSSIALIIGLLTLLGAAVALTNIMLICVAERTREVGIRRAVGATRTNIRDAFLAEAMLICEAGCLAGTLLGILCGNVLGLVLHTDMGIPWDWIMLAQVICLSTGIAACTLPARRAARINVVEALRCE